MVWVVSIESYSGKGVVDSSSRVKQARFLSGEFLHGGPVKLLNEAVKVKLVLLGGPSMLQLSEP